MGMGVCAISLPSPSRVMTPEIWCTPMSTDHSYSKSICMFASLYSSTICFDIPFVRSVRRFSCGLFVNVMAYRGQPYVFWREMLKELMHSMSMALIREKAVRNFMKRIGNHVEQLTVGWLELRKGFHTFLTSNGDLVVFKDGVLMTEADERTDSRRNRPTAVGDCVDNAAARSLQGMISDTAGEECTFFSQDFSGRLGPWSVSCRVVAKNADDGEIAERCWQEHLTRANSVRILESPRDLLGGSFAYSLVLPNDAACLQLIQQVVGNGAREGKYKPPPALRSIDVKLRAGIPLLVPSLSGPKDVDKSAPPPADSASIDGLVLQMGQTSLSGLRVVEIVFGYEG